jgi:hypothetical protein
VTARVEKALNSLRREIAGLKTRLALPAYLDAQTEQAQALLHFLGRTLQISQACVLLCGSDLDVPLTILMRVACEDMFLCFWVARSEADAAEYRRAVDAESVRLVRIMLENKRGQIRHKSTKEDKTAEALRRLKGMNTDGFKIEQIVDKLGMKKVYDIVYRPSSFQVHGKSFGALMREGEEGVYATLSALVALVEAIGLIADNRTLRNQPTMAEEVLRLLRIENLGGR